MIVDDGRRYLYRNDGKFDIVMIDPLRTTTAYSNNLYSEEFFALVKGHLKTGGVIGVYNGREYDIMTNTLLRVFKHINVYRSFAIASDGALISREEKYDALVERFQPGMQARIRKTRSAVMFNELGFSGSGRYNTDMEPRLEYYIWRAIEGLK